MGQNVKRFIVRTAIKAYIPICFGQNRGWECWRVKLYKLKLNRFADTLILGTYVIHGCGRSDPCHCYFRAGWGLTLTPSVLRPCADDYVALQPT